MVCTRAASLIQFLLSLISQFSKFYTFGFLNFQIPNSLYFQISNAIFKYSYLSIFVLFDLHIFKVQTFKVSNFRIFRFRNPSAFGSLILNFSNDLSLISEFETDRESVRIYIFSVLYISMFSNFLIAVSRNFGTELLSFQLLCFANIRSTSR